MKMSEIFNKVEKPTELELKNLPQIPVDEKEFTYKITVEKITRKRKFDTNKLSVSLKDGSIVTDTWRHTEGEDYFDIQVPSGSQSVSSNSEKVYEQEIPDLSISDLALHLNRVR